MTTTNRRIATRAEVEAVATEQESESLDYKTDADPTEWWELAKDIAAFANHLGGVILVGATEQKQNGLPNLHGLPVAKIAALAQAYEMAARDKCRPAALATFDRIPWDGGREILAVNVSAYVGGLVGAMVCAPDVNGKPQTTDAWQFPMRVGKHNPSLPLEQAIMHMSTHARRVAILLASITDRKNIAIHWEHPRDAQREKFTFREPAECSLRDFSVERNVAYFVLDGTLAAATIPLDDIDAVWSEEDGSWAVRVSGFFEELLGDDGKPEGIYVTRPRRAAVR